MERFQRYNGWLLLAHPAFEDQYNRLINEVRSIISNFPDSFQTQEKVKLFAHLEKRMFQDIPNDPAAQQWRLGNSLGPDNRSWRRAKFGGQYRLFFRFDSRAKIIVFGWINDQSTLRAYESSDDAYLVFRKRLAQGNPPESWAELIGQSRPLGS